MKRLLILLPLCSSAVYAATPDDLQKGLTAPLDGDMKPRHALGSREVVADGETFVPQPPTIARWPVDFSVYSPPLETSQTLVVEPGQSFKSRILVQNPGTGGLQREVTFTLLDFWGKVRDSRKINLQLAPNEKKALVVPFTAPETGAFKVAVSLAHQGKTLERDVASFAVWPQPQAPNPASFFGHHVNSWSEGTVAQAVRLGLSWNRAHNMLQHTWWSRVQPERDSAWMWDSNGHRTRMQKNNMTVLGQLFGTPYWAAVGKPRPKPANMNAYPSGARPDLEAFRKYVFETVKHLPEIRVWEVWNEPEVSMFWNGSPEEFGELCRVAYEAAKAADPTVMVLNGGYTQSAFVWDEKAAQAGALKYTDGISVHLHHSATATPEALEKQVRGQVERWQELARKYAGKELPIWDTESGSGDTTWLRGYENPKLPPEHLRTPMNWREAAISAVQIDVIKQSLGIVRSFSYLWQPSSPGVYEELNALDMTNAPKPKLIARVNLAHQLNGANFVRVVRRDEGRLWAGIYEKPTGSVAVLWSGRGGRVQVSLAAELAVTQIDLMGNRRPVTVPEIGEEPLFLLTSRTATALSEALAGANIKVLQQPESLPVEAAQNDAPAVPNLPDFVAPGENPAGVFFLDLRRVANMAFADEKAGDGQGGWADEGSLNSLHSMPLGRQTLYGVPFDIIDPKTNEGKAIVTLKGNNVTPNHPAQVSIAVNQTARNLYFLHAASWGVPGDIGRYIVRYADGQSVEILLKIPANINNWWDGYAAGEESRPVPLRVTQTLDGKPAWRYVRVFEWQNPRRQVPITAIEAASGGGARTPILIAVTGLH